ncbi:MAG: hypothetical protein LAP13_08920 [Acidobacteriia bacterium]|nr:hypothetical protein [Terriglobia bacterium]
MKKRLGGGGASRSANFVLPSVALELQQEFVAGARLDGSGHQVRSISVRELQPGWLSAVVNHANVVDVAGVRRAVNQVAEAVGNGGGRLGLLLPDAAVRVALLQFETLPDPAGACARYYPWSRSTFGSLTKFCRALNRRWKF